MAMEAVAAEEWVSAPGTPLSDKSAGNGGVGELNNGGEHQADSELPLPEVTPGQPSGLPGQLPPEEVAAAPDSSRAGHRGWGLLQRMAKRSGSARRARAGSPSFGSARSFSRGYSEGGHSYGPAEETVTGAARDGQMGTGPSGAHSQLAVASQAVTGPGVVTEADEGAVSAAARQMAREEDGDDLPAEHALLGLHCFSLKLVVYKDSPPRESTALPSTVPAVLPAGTDPPALPPSRKLLRGGSLEAGTRGGWQALGHGAGRRLRQMLSPRSRAPSGREPPPLPLLPPPAEGSGGGGEGGLGANPTPGQDQGAQAAQMQLAGGASAAGGTGTL